MGEYREHSKILPVGAVMLVPDVKIDSIANSLTDYFRGEVVLSKQFRVQDFTNYYDDEMGDELYKYFYYVRSLHPIEGSEEWKVWSNMQEEKYKTETGMDRPVNIDPGYLALSKLVLFSTKGFSHRVYIRNKVFAEVTLQYRHKAFHDLPWTYSDYKTAEAYLFWNQARAELDEMLGPEQKYS
ncbi:MAG: DUF4416 family protein [Candidatus Marinimicrobia bacterium]|nr:DUF4416 family protein [Candidatus Neomarinimicrobiota bacterium]